MSLHDNQVPALPQEHAVAAPGAKPETLKLINVGPSADAQHVDFHFLTTANRVTTVQLDMTVATGLYKLLGETLDRVRGERLPRPPARLN